MGLKLGEKEENTGRNVLNLTTIPSFKFSLHSYNFSCRLTYVCPMCRRVFRGPKGFKELAGDHIYPFSKGGLTTWDNLQLICLRCNSQKGSMI